MPYIMNNGINIHYQIEGSGPPLILLHGLFGSIENWYAFGYVEELKKEYKLNSTRVKRNIWHIDNGFMRSTKDKFAYKHPAMFPEKLSEDHIISWSNESDIIFDPMCGSGTTLKMAQENNRNFIGVDISEEYVNIAKERCGIHRQ